MATPSKYFSNNNMSGNGKVNETDTKQGAGSQPVKAILIMVLYNRVLGPH